MFHYHLLYKQVPIYFTTNTKYLMQIFWIDNMKVFT